MSYLVYRIEDDALVLGYTFEKMTELLKAAYRLTAFSGDGSVDGFTINGLPLRGSFSSDEDAFRLERGIRCYENVSCEKTRWHRSNTRREDRWALAACYEKTTGDQFDEEYEFTLTNRDYKAIGKKICKLSVRSIILRQGLGDQVIEEEPVAKAVRVLDDLLADVQRSTSNLAEWAASPYGMVVRCTKCQHQKTLEPTKIASLFRDFVSLQEVSKKLRCGSCDQKGQVETIPVVGASLDRRSQRSGTTAHE